MLRHQYPCISALLCCVTRCPLLHTAQLLRQDRVSGGPEEDRDLLEAADRSQRRDNVRLQVPVRGGQDPLPVWNGAVPRLSQLVMRVGGVICPL